MERAWSRTVAYLRSLTRRYYEEKARLWLPHDFPLREFAAQLWGGKGYVRHMAFSSMSQVHEFLARRAPRHFYFSSARYEQPGIEDMDSKGWRSADIVFDIDADHLAVCSDKVIRVDSPFEGETSLLPDECIKPAALETVRLVEALREELGFENDKVRVEFSGHRGFHVTIYLTDDDERARAGQDYRRELVNYLRGVGVRRETLEPHSQLRLRRPMQPLPPLTWMAGLRGRAARAARRLLLARGLVGAARVLEERDPVRVVEMYRVHRQSIDEALAQAWENIGINIDEQVTVDTKRLIRVPGSINGKTGLVVKEVRSDKVEQFEMEPDLSGFGEGEARVEIVADIPAVRLLGYRIRLRRGDKPRLPLPLAGLLMAKGLAVLAS